jgi:molybdate transport system substrate-binding protein
MFLNYMMMKKIVVILAALAISVSMSAQVIRVAAAANLKFVLEEIKAQYQKENPKSRVDITYGASGSLVQQILNGASFDFFMAADKEFPTKLKAKGATLGGIKTYAYGKLVMWSNSVDVAKGTAVLTNGAVKKIAIANPQTAPYGERSVEFLKKKGMFDALKAKIVYADNISQAAQYAFSGNAEIGFTAMSLVLAPDMKEAGKYYEIPASEYTPIDQACVLIKKKQFNPGAAKFMNYVLNPKVKAIWEKWGYKVN